MKFICRGSIAESSQQLLSEEDLQRMMEECFAYDDVDLIHLGSIERDLRHRQKN